MKERFHICQSVQGALKNWKKIDWNELARENKIPPEKLKVLFRIMDFEGKKVIPIGKACEGFSYETGCPGHLIEEEEKK